MSPKFHHPGTIRNIYSNTSELSHGADCDETQST
jgi:hypothetical protein